jgi:fructose/tagatose bisphosphate aldolase
MARITLRQLLDHAAEHSYGVPAFNINNMEQGLAIMEAAASVDAPVIIQARACSAPPRNRRAEQARGTGESVKRRMVL